MLNEIKRYERDSEFCRRILSVATVAYRPFHLAEIGGLSGLPEQIAKSIENVQKIVAKCGSFLTVRDDQIYLVHQSAKDYLSNQASALLFPYGAAMAHHDMSNRSLELLSNKLRRNVYGLYVPGFPIDQVRVPDPDPLATVRYSCIYWLDHICESQSDDNIKHSGVFQDGGIIDGFLRQHYLHWLEALSLYGGISQRIFSITKLKSILQLPSLIYNIHRFILYCNWLAKNHPLQVYTSALVFSPARSITRNLFTQKEPSWIDAGPIIEDNWNVYTQTFEGHSGAILSVAFSPDSKLVISRSDNKTVKIWDTTTDTYTQTLKGHNGYVFSVAFSPDSKLVISKSNNKTTKIWDTTAGTYTQTLEEYNGSIKFGVLSPDSKLLASCSFRTTVKIQDIATGTCTQTLKRHSSYINSIAFSPDSKLVISGSDDKTVKMWDTATGICTQTFEGHNDWVSSVAFSPDSKLVASGSYDNTVRIWDTTTDTNTQMFDRHSYSVTAIAFSPDLKLVASWSFNTIKIWDASTGICTQTLDGYDWSFFLYTWLSGVETPFYQDYGISSDGRWITKGWENWLWLPPGCQSKCFAIAASTIAIGCSSGRVLIMRFPAHT